jgi:hypothetical protein
MLAAIACTKFKDDSFISFRGAEHRLNGNWKVSTIEVDGVDSTSFELGLRTGLMCTFCFTNPRGGVYNYGICGCDANNYAIFNKQISFTNFWDTSTVKKSNLPLIKFNIQKLYKKDFWIAMNHENRNILIKFTKQ